MSVIAASGPPPPRPRQAGLVQFFAGLAATCDLWMERHRQRHALAELAEQDHRLVDIGVSRLAARREAARPFWDNAELEESSRRRLNHGAWATLAGLLILLALLHVFAPTPMPTALD